MSTSKCNKRRSGARKENCKSISGNMDTLSYQKIRELGVPFPKRSRKSKQETRSYKRKDHSISFPIKAHHRYYEYKYPEDFEEEESNRFISSNNERTEYDFYDIDYVLNMDKKKAFLRALKESPKTFNGRKHNAADERDSFHGEKEAQNESQDFIRLFVGNLFNSVENTDIERLLEQYGRVVEVRRYEKHAIVTVKCSKETAEKAIKELDHNHWMDNWIRVKFDKFEMSKEESWKKKIKKFSLPTYPIFEHCDRGQIQDEACEMDGEVTSKSTSLLTATAKCKMIDSKSKRGLSEYLKTIRHNHCVEVVDSMVKAKDLGTLEIYKLKEAIPVIKGTIVTSSKQDPRKPIEYADMEF